MKLRKNQSGQLDVKIAHLSQHVLWVLGSFGGHEFSRFSSKNQQLSVLLMANINVSSRTFFAQFAALVRRGETMPLTSRNIGFRSHSIPYVPMCPSFRILALPSLSVFRRSEHAD